MVDTSLQFLNDYDSSMGDDNEQDTAPIEVEETTTPVDSMLDFLNDADATAEATPPVVSADKVVEAEKLDTSILIPRADSPDWLGTEVEPIYEYDKDRRYKEAVIQADETDAFLEGLTPEEKETFFAEVSADIRKGNTDEGGIATPLDFLMSKVPAGGLITFGNYMNKFGAMTMDNVEGALNAVQEYSPAAFDALDSFITGGRYSNQENPEDLAEFLRDGFGAAGEFMETLPALNQVRNAVDRVIYSGPRNTAVGISNKVVAERKALEKARRTNVGGADLAGREVAETARKEAANIANANRNIADDLIRSFEDTTGKVISRKEGDHLVIDTELSREAGVETAKEITERDGALFDLSIGDDIITSPLLQPDKFDGIVAAAVDLQNKFPDSFNNNNSVIDNLLELTINRDLELDGQDLVDTLDKYNLSFEDYVLTVVGSGSEAGRILNKLSQIKRVKPTGVAITDKEKIKVDSTGKVRKFIMRVENIRRGGLVSQLATASRNLTSGGIRLPLESLGNVMDQAIYASQNKGVFAGAKELMSGDNWKDSFKAHKYVFSRPDIADGYSNLILKSPELNKQFDRMFNNLNEIQSITGRGEGGAVDSVLSGLEDTVDFLNTPNRWQEHLMRRGVFFSELERLTKREYGIDLMSALNDGKLKALLNDASGTGKPKDARSFMGLVDDSVNKALDVTYAKQPEIPVFRATSQFITRNGLTVVVPFPRFMFNSMELMGQYAAGGSIPLTRKMASLVTGGKVGGGPLTAKDRQRITRNMQGIAAVGAAYMYRTSDEAPAEYEKVPVGDKAQLDTTATYPMAQFLYAGEATKRLIDGTFDDWFDSKEFVELFTGSNFRTGVGNSILDEIAQIADATDLTKGESVGRALGRPLGNYLSTWAVPFGQIIDAERATGLRGTKFKETGSDPDLSFLGAFTRETVKPFKVRGLALSTAEEEALPDKEYAGFYDGRERMYPGAKFLGLSMTSAPSEDVEYLGELGLNWRDLGSRSKVPSIKNFEIKMLNEKILPTVVEMAKKHEEKLINEYSEANALTQEEFTEREYVANKLRPLIQAQIKKFKGMITKVSVSEGDSYTRAITKYRRIPAGLRKIATTDFVERYGEVPDPMDAEHLRKLNIIADVYGKTYRE